MNTRTQEAIEFINGIKHSGNGYGNSYISDFNKFKDIVALLQQSEQYRQMWEKFCVNEGDLVKVVNCIKNRYEQKYFPKEVIKNEVA